MWYWCCQSANLAFSDSCNVSLSFTLSDTLAYNNRQTPNHPHRSGPDPAVFSFFVNNCFYKYSKWESQHFFFYNYTLPHPILPHPNQTPGGPTPSPSSVLLIKRGLSRWALGLVSWLCLKWQTISQCSTMAQGKVVHYEGTRVPLEIQIKFGHIRPLWKGHFFPSVESGCYHPNRPSFCFSKSPRNDEASIALRTISRSVGSL